MTPAFDTTASLISLRNAGSRFFFSYATLQKRAKLQKGSVIQTLDQFLFSRQYHRSRQVRQRSENFATFDAYADNDLLEIFSVD